MNTVTRPYLPSREKLNAYIDGIYERNWLTNNGPLVQELTRRLQAYLGISHLLLVANGTLALQVAYRALNVTDHAAAQRVEAITSPFSFIATASSLKWEGIEPIFVDIDAHTWCLDPVTIEAAISPRTKAIVPVHVFGNACAVEAIDAVAKRHGLKVIYDGSHAFGVTYKEASLLRHGDATTLSFHATKLFHTVEGGAVIFKHKADLERARKLINFGMQGPVDIDELGINAKMNEFQAAMGLCVLDEMEINLRGRADAWHGYAQALTGRYQMQARHPDCSNNYAYFPMLFESEQALLEKIDSMRVSGVGVRRYFHPSLDAVGLFKADHGLRRSRGVASRVACLPLYYQADYKNVLRLVLGDDFPARH